MTTGRAMAWSLRTAFYGVAAIGVLAGGGYFLLTMALQSRNWTACINQDHAAAPDVVIAGCNAVVESVILTNDNRAKAFIGRGDAFRTRNELDHALADYSEATRLDPKSTLAFNASASTAAQVELKRLGQ
jgi:cytochrome c-type biogenesis protein CcmH/NrfG